ncbi:MAG TPA: cupin domain-containing protein [Bacteroidia bacterium]|jgi:predicted cupin superfamily sugar epimerase|nr:cupin domain-containing protein [Bacteroidia bacterium]
MNDRPSQLIQQLQLAPHPEGGHYREIFRSELKVGFNSGERDALTSIYFLLQKGEASRWHVVDADEVWHFYEGDQLELWIMPPDLSKAEKIILGEVSEHSKPVHVIPAGWWQAARSIGEYTLCGCSVAPGFEFAGFRFLKEEEKEKVKLLKEVPEKFL